MGHKNADQLTLRVGMPIPTAGLVETMALLTTGDLVGNGVEYQAMIPGNEFLQPPHYCRWTGTRKRHYANAKLLSGKFSRCYNIK